jgi:acetoin utilization protein AcuC
MNEKPIEPADSRPVFIEVSKPISAMSKQTYLIHSDEYKNWIFDPSHPTQGRRFNNARDLLITAAKKEGIDVIEKLPRLATEAELLRVHTPAYIDEVLNQHISTEWDGERVDLANLASLFVGGTLTALDALLTNKTKLAIHFPGAKHHAQSDHSSGFCIFNDFAIAADIASKDHGKNIIIIDIDAHHGDGVENLTADNPKVLTFSVHQDGIFPGTGEESKPGYFYNIALKAGAGDKELLDAIEQFIYVIGARDRIWDWQPDLLFITCGADGHSEDSLTGLNYSVEGYITVMKKFKATFPELPILLGGAGGYLPDTRTPEIWAKVALGLANFI